MYKAYHKGLARVVAVKVLALAASRDPQAIMRFKAEAASMNALDHPHIAKVLSFGMIDTAPYLVLEYIDGGSLADKLRAPMRLTECWMILAQLAAGLAEAHTKNIIHRDIKPGNIMFSGDTLKIVDFGIAKSLDGGEGQKLTQTGSLLGTPLYMSPEQLAGQPAGMESDVYSVGCILHEMLYNRPFVAGNSVIEIAMNQTVADRKFPSKTAAGEPVPKPLRAMLQQMLELERKNRIPDGTKLYELVQSIRAQPDKMPDSLRTTRIHISRRLPLKKLSLLLLPVVAGAIAVSVAMTNERKPDNELMSRLRNCRIVIDKDGDAPEWHDARKALESGLNCSNEQVREFAEQTLREAASRRYNRDVPLDADAIWILDRATKLPVNTDQELTACIAYYFRLVHHSLLQYQSSDDEELSKIEQPLHRAFEYFDRAADEMKKHNYKFPPNPSGEPTMLSLLVRQMVAQAGATVPRMNQATSDAAHSLYARSGLALSARAVQLIEHVQDTFKPTDREWLQNCADLYIDYLIQAGDAKRAAEFRRLNLQRPFWQNVFSKQRTTYGAPDYSMTGPLRGA